jgi:hypothetical protein
MKNILYYMLGASLLMLSACSLDEDPQTSLGKDAVFNSDGGLQAYSYSFYDGLPTANSIQQSESSLVDYFATSSISGFIHKGAFNESNETSWSWSTLRNINYFIVNCEKSTVKESVKNNYLGLARFFRAYFYYDKVKRYGDVPWIDKPLDVDDPELYAARDSREKVMENVYADLQFAEQNITQAKESTCTLVTKWVAYALASRVALFEGTYRKYHNLSLATSAATWLQRAAESAQYIMTNGGYSLYTTSDGTAYRQLFTSDNPKTAEIMLAVCSSASLNVYHMANWQWNVSTYGNCPNFIRTYVNTYLMLDGTPYTNKSGYETEDFYEECQNRDYRLSASMRTPGYKREGSLALPDFAGYARIGYHPMKFCVDSKAGDATSNNTNALPLFRYAEVLLNYAEAKAELGTLTDDDWAKTIGLLRARGGITAGLKTKPTTIDPYMKANYFPTVTDPSIMEIRRERAVELCFEGFRFDDIRRWDCGKLLLMPWKGMYIAALNKALDVDHNGTPDVIYYTDAAGLTSAKAGIDWNTYKSTCATVKVTTDLTASGVQVIPQGDGYYLAWDSQENALRVFGKKQYLYPIPSLVMVKNPNITQNAGWENGSSNDGSDAE